MDGYLLCSMDVGGTIDPAAAVVMHVAKRDRVTRAKVLQMALKNPIVTPSMHVEWVQEIVTKLTLKVGRGPVRFAVDISNNSAIAFLLGQALPRDSLIGVKITAGESHGAGVQPFLIGDVGGRATSIPALNLSRRQLLLDIGAAFQSGQLTLPLEDPEQQQVVHELKRQMSRASLKVTPSGKQVAVVDRGHDDLLMALAQAWAVTKLPPPRETRIGRAASAALPAPTAAGWT
jgi:hypothetical protein